MIMVKVGGRFFWGNPRTLLQIIEINDTNHQFRISLDAESLFKIFIEAYP